MHDWINNCIRDWARKWDPSLMTITVWPNLHQRIIAMLSGGMTGQFCELIRGKPTKVLKPRLAPKCADLGISTLLVFWGRRSDRLLFFHILDFPSIRDPFFNSLDLPNTRSPQIWAILGSRSFLQPSFMNSWSPI